MDVDPRGGIAALCVCVMMVLPLLPNQCRWVFSKKTFRSHKAVSHFTVSDFARAPSIGEEAAATARTSDLVQFTPAMRMAFV